MGTTTTTAMAIKNQCDSRQQNATIENPPEQKPGKAPGSGAAETAKPIWPDYFARLGQPDAITWHYAGYWKDTIRVWKAYYGFILSHPIIAFQGCRQFFQALAYRVFGQAVGDRSALLLSLLAPLFMLTTPFLSLLAVAIAKIPFMKKLVPPLFQPFSYMGWTNYCIMLSLVFGWHGYKQRKQRLHPMQANHHSSKLFWNEFFSANLGKGLKPTSILAVVRHGHFSAPLPRENIIIKPIAGGAGHKLRSLQWDDSCGVYRCNDIEHPAADPRAFTAHELELYIRSQNTNFVIERWERPRRPLPISSLRVLTLNIDGASELLCVAFLPAPEGSVSTAYFDLDIYLIDYSNSRIGKPIRHDSDGKYIGIKLPELNAITTACLQLHNALPGHIEISWDILLSAEGPIFLEGNVFPPGCDYKLSIFKNDENIKYIKNRILNPA